MRRDGVGVRALPPPLISPGGGPAKHSDAGHESLLTCIFTAELVYWPTRATRFSTGRREG